MSQNKTVVPGMNGASLQDDQPRNFYTRENTSKSFQNGTVVPYMEQNSIISENAHQDGAYAVPNNNSTGKPVVGFLYSISRKGIGEYWPLHIGQNSIGNSQKCNICLREGTVSEEHAILMVRKMRNPDKTIASICDARSTNGTMLNGESLAFSAVECKNNDIITIGENYQLVLLLIDSKALGLSISEGFIAMDQVPDSYNEKPMYDSDEMINSSYDSYGNLPNQNFDPYTNHYTDGTVGLDGSTDSEPGGTKTLK